MLYKILADIIVVMHFAWILFMLVGFILTIKGFWWKGFFDKWLFRTIHLFGIIYVSSLAVLRQYCPLTILENNLRAGYDPSLVYPGSFMVHYLERLVYPDVYSWIILLPTIFIAVFTIIIFIVKPPPNIKRILFR